MSDNTYLLVLRLLHIGCGVMWAGTVIFLAFFVDPAIEASGPQGAKVMQQLLKTNRFPIVIMILAIVTVVAGVLLIWKVSDGLQSAWLASENGKVLTGGAVMAIAAFIIGFIINRPAGARIAKIGKEIALTGTPPTESQLGEIKRLGRKLAIATKIMAFLLILAIVGMSAFRYI